MNNKYIMRIHFILLIIIAVLFSNFFFTENSSGSDKTDLLTIGEGRIKGNNIADARKEAIADALKKRIDEYLSLYLGSQVMISNFSLLVNDIIPIAAEEIENFHILAEEKKGETYSMLVRVKVNEKLIEQKLRDMGIVNIEGTSIKVLFLVSQNTDSKEKTSFWWNNPDNNSTLTTTDLKLYNIFQAQGIEPVNRLSSPIVEKISEEMRRLDLSTEAAIKWGKIFSADVIIVGKSKVQADNTVVVDLEAIDIEDGKSICRTGTTEQIISGDTGDNRFMNALETAINNIAIQFGPEIIKYFNKNSEVSNKIQIELNELNNLKEFRLFKNFLEKEIKGIKSITQSRLNGKSMTLVVEFFGKKDLFINKLKGHENFPFQADITTTKEGDIIIEIKNEMLEPMSDHEKISHQD